MDSGEERVVGGFQKSDDGCCRTGGFFSVNDTNNNLKQKLKSLEKREGGGGVVVVEASMYGIKKTCTRADNICPSKLMSSGVKHSPQLLPVCDIGLLKHGSGWGLR